MLDLPVVDVVSVLVWRVLSWGWVSVLCDELFCYAVTYTIVIYNCTFVGCNKNDKRCTVHALK